MNDKAGTGLPLPIPVNPDRLGERRAAALSEQERELYRWVLNRLAAGSTATGHELEAASRDLDLRVDEAAARLEELDLVLRDHETGDVRCAYPVSVTPTAHVVTLAGQARPVYAMCAVDALGIPFMVRATATVTSADPSTGEQVEVVVDPNGDVRWEPADAVVVAGGLAQVGSASTLCCPIINFFESRSSAEGFLAQRPDLDAAVLSMPDAVALGRAVFEGLLG